MNNDPLAVLVKSSRITPVGALKRGGGTKRFRVVHSNQVIDKKFDTWAEASKWADENYKSHGNAERRALWKIIVL